MDKREQRRKALEGRRMLSEKQRQEHSRRLCDRLFSIPEVSNAKLVLAYAATYDEANLSYFAEKAKFRGAKVAYPVSYKAGIMKAFVPDSDDAWHVGLLGIRAPVEEHSELIDPKNLDLVLVPCVGFDEKCRRLGYGGGYYDRYLPQCVNARFICVAFEVQKLYNLVTYDHDVPMECVVTEDNIYWPE